jgi:hypothetical protein
MKKLIVAVVIVLLAAAVANAQTNDQPLTEQPLTEKEVDAYLDARASKKDHECFAFDQQNERVSTRLRGLAKVVYLERVSSKKLGEVEKSVEKNLEQCRAALAEAAPKSKLLETGLALEKARKEWVAPRCAPTPSTPSA